VSSNFYVLLDIIYVKRDLILFTNVFYKYVCKIYFCIK